MAPRRRHAPDDVDRSRAGLNTLTGDRFTALPDREPERGSDRPPFGGAILALRAARARDRLAAWQHATRLRLPDDHHRRSTR
ncbi:hypothetical protein RHRU231_750171 [Rhodococcus ruber]|uniref:Uncharacterized protein n=1 Tax=Rhodococcus ruber TaxID=1830 RepID=A0A098BQ35_9NOCA|nr:hypothetical protein RHRU231_750171 [Rhodococcus ruber]